VAGPFGAEYGTIRSLLFLSETGVRQCELLLHLLLSTISCHQISEIKTEACAG